MTHTITVTTAVELSDKQLATLTQKFEKKFGQVQVVTVVDSTVVGGIKIRVGSQEYDATLKQKLESIKSQLLAQW